VPLRSGWHDPWPAASVVTSAPAAFVADADVVAFAAATAKGGETDDGAKDAPAPAVNP